MKTNNDKARPVHQQKDSNQKKTLMGYPVYPDNEDIYIKCVEEKDINPEDISRKKDTERGIEQVHPDDISGKDLDIPGAELDDDQEHIGSEDEENNYYSLGGDDHNNLEEDKGD